MRPGTLTPERNTSLRVIGREGSVTGRIMNQLARNIGVAPFAPAGATVDVMSGEDVRKCRRWRRALARNRKDHRYYDIVEDTIRQSFDYRYFAIRDDRGEVRAVIPFFLLDLDLLAGLGHFARLATALVRRLWPRFMLARALMVGCTAGEGHLDDPDEVSHAEQAQLLAASLADHAVRLGAPMVVFKEFPAKYRSDLKALLQAGFSRAPSFPMTRLDIDHPSFDDFMVRVLSAKTRKDLRVKFRAAAAAPAIELRVVSDITPMIEELYPLYLQVYERAQFRFEKLSREFLCRLGRRMPDKVRFFVWQQQGRAIAFSLCMVQDDEIFGEYLGFDYTVALDLHLYHYVFRDVVTWAIARGYKTLRINGANYDPKLHLRFRLDPVDLYVRHTSRAANFMLARLLPFLVPTRYDPILPRFPNFHELDP